jgi:thiamine-phosphate pyrophosphorylase
VDTLPPTIPAVYRILDANCNRLREALRVIEEYFRFLENNEVAAIELKGLRHRLIEVEEKLGPQALLQNRDVANDCFADTNRPEEMERSGGTAALLAANIRRAQEAARVIEEYAKLTDTAEASETAKRIRFSLYRFEQHFIH